MKYSGYRDAEYTMKDDGPIVCIINAAQSHIILGKNHEFIINFVPKPSNCSNWITAIISIAEPHISINGFSGHQSVFFLALYLYVQWRSEAAALIQFDLGTKQDHYFISFGPSLDIQIKGKEKYKLMTGESINKDMRFSYGDYGRYSIAAIGRFGYEFNNELMIFVQYNMGLGSINNADNGPIILHRVFGISIARVLHW